MQVPLLNMVNLVTRPFASEGGPLFGRVPVNWSYTNPKAIMKFAQTAVILARLSRTSQPVIGPATSHIEKRARLTVLLKVHFECDWDEVEYHILQAISCHLE